MILFCYFLTRPGLPDAYGSDEGGKASADIYILIESAKMNGLNPEWYLKKVMSVIQDYNSKKIANLLPWNIVPDTS